MEKKKQKTFVSALAAQKFKSFLVLFFKKELLPSSSVEARIDQAYQPQTPARSSRTPTTSISLVLPVFNTPPDLLAACIASVRAQTTPHWQLCIADDASTAPHLPKLLADIAATDPRITITRLPTNQGIAAASNAAIGLATGDFVGFLDHDDLLAPHALARMASASADADILFSDEDQIRRGRRAAPYFKPGWDPELLRAQNMVGHLAIYRRTLLARLGGLAAGFDGSQDWELALRATAAVPAARIRHVPDVLYHWRQRAGSFSATHGATAQAAGCRAVQAHLPPGAIATPDAALPQWVRVTYPVPQPAPLVSIITPPGAEPPLDPAYPNTEWLQGKRGTAAARAVGAVLLFIAGDLALVAAGWLAELVSHAMRPEVGAAGPRIDGRRGRIAQSGLILHPQAIAHTLHPASDADDPGYRGQFRLTRSVSALSLDCLAVRRDVFQAAGGLDAACGPYADVDLCLRIAALGLRCVWTPHARLRYLNRPGVTPDPEAARLMRARWGSQLARDPYLNPNLVVRHDTLALAPPPAGQRKTYDS